MINRAICRIYCDSGYEKVIFSWVILGYFIINNDCSEFLVAVRLWHGQVHSLL